MNKATKILYNNSKNLNTFARIKSIPSFPFLWFLTDLVRCPNPYALIKQLPKNTGVVLRDYDNPNRSVIATKIAQICKKKHLIFLVGGDARLAIQVGASGIHIPEYRDFKGPKFLKKNWIISSSVHNLASLKRIQSLNLDCIFISPVFYTNSHPNITPLGTLKIAKLVRELDTFSIALGGINSDNAKLLCKTGINGIGAISGFL